MFHRFITASLLGRRIDSNYYSPEALKQITRLQKSGLEISSISEVCHRRNSGPFGSSLLASSYVPEGIDSVIFFRPVDCKDAIANIYNDNVYISKGDNIRLSSSSFGAGSLILTKIGNSIGDVSIVPICIDKCNISGNMMGMDTDKIDPYFLLAYLRSLSGVAQINRGIIGGPMPKIDMESISEIQIPIPDTNIQRYLGNKIRKAERLIELSKSCLQHATKLLNKLFEPYIDPPEYPIEKSKSVDEPRDTYFEKFIPPYDLNDRLIAQPYRPDVLFAIKTIKKMPNVELLGHMVKDKIAQGVTPIYAPSGVMCLKTKNVEGVFITTENTDFVGQNFFQKNTRSTIAPNTILLNRQGAGSIGRSGIYLGTESICINDSLFRISMSDYYDPAYVVLFLNSWFGERQIEQGINGSTGQLTLGQEHLKYILIPCPDITQQKLIGDEVRNSYEMKENAKKYIRDTYSSMDLIIEGEYHEDNILKKSKEIECWLKENPSPNISGRNS